MTTMLETRDLRKAFGGLVAVDDVSIEVQKGELSAIIGPNGAGKTTFFNLLNGAITPDSGTVMLDGQDITGSPPHRSSRAGIGRSFQVASVFHEYTVRENIQMAVTAHHGDHRMPWRTRQNSHEDEVEALIEEIGFVDRADTVADELSHGDIKILDMAMALASGPVVLLLDEPAAGLNAVEADRVMKVVADLHQERGLTVVFIEHDMSMVFGYASIVRVLHEGRMVAEGSPEEIRGSDEVKRIYLGGYEGA